MVLLLNQLLIMVELFLLLLSLLVLDMTPEVTIGVGFGAVAKANIDTDGENAGKVTSIDIINRGVVMPQGTALINLVVGEGALFTSNVFSGLTTFKILQL